MTTMIAAERTCFEAARDKVYPNTFDPKKPPPPLPSPSPAAPRYYPPLPVDLIDDVATARNKRHNRIDKYFILAVHPNKSTGYGLGHSNRPAKGHPNRLAQPNKAALLHRNRYATVKMSPKMSQGHTVDKHDYMEDIHNRLEHHHHFNDNNERMTIRPNSKVEKEQIYLDAAEIVRQHGPNLLKKEISAFQKDPNSPRLHAKVSQQSDPLRFQPNLSTLKGLNFNREVEAEARNVVMPVKKIDSGRPKKLIQSQVTSVDRLARSKWRRDPINERLLFLTSHTKHQIQDPEYVKHLDSILKTKHNEKEGDRIAALAEVERDREWLWSVKYDLDFSHMEKASLDQHRVERKEAAEADLSRQDAMFSSAGKQSFYTVATRTHGLDKMRNIKELRQMHNNNIRNNIRKGIANPRCSWLLHAMENGDEEMVEFLKAETASQLYLASESIVRDTATVEEQQKSEEEKQEMAVKAKKAEERE